MKAIHVIIEKANLEWPEWANFLTVDAGGAWFWELEPYFTNPVTGWQIDEDVKVKSIDVPGLDEYLDELDLVETSFETCIWRRSDQNMLQQLLDKYEFDLTEQDGAVCTFTRSFPNSKTEFVEILIADDTIPEETIQAVALIEYDGSYSGYNNRFSLPIDNVESLTYLLKALFNNEN